MNALIAYTDTAKALKLLEWTAELGGVRAHDLILQPFKGLDPAPVVEVGKRAFKSVRVEPDYEGIKSNWSNLGEKKQASAAGPNSSFRQAAWAVYTLKLGPFFFWEPDAVPLVPTWLDQIEAEYKRAGKPFMGALVPASVPNKVPAHLTGNAVCPENVVEIAPSMVLCKELAFDVAGAAEVVPRAHVTNLIQHVFFHPRYPEQPTFPDQESLKLIRDDAVLFHRNKDLTAIDRLRERKNPPALGFGSEGLPPSQPVVVPSTTEKTATKVFTYFAPCLPIIDEQNELLSIWEREWRKEGFEPAILTENDVRKHPNLKEWELQLLAKPTINPPNYERACWLRWIAMAALPHGECYLMTDYDVLPNGFKEYLPLHCADPRPLPWLLANHVPCAVLGTAAEFENAVKAFLTCQPDSEQERPHLSDMHACQMLNFPRMAICREPGKVRGTMRSDDARLLHFSNAIRNGRLRSEIIEEWLKAKELGEHIVSTGKEWHAAGMPAPTAEALDSFAGIGPLHAAPTIVGQFRHHIGAIKKICAESASRKIILFKELRKAGLISGPKRRKKKRWKL